MKQEQVAARLHDLRQSLVQVIVPHYVPADLDKRLRERLAVAGKIDADLAVCVTHNAFGAFVRRFCVERGAMADVLYQAQLKHAAVRGLVPAAARALMQAWTEQIHSTGEDEAFSGQTGVSQKSLVEIANELAATSRRLQVEDQIRVALDKVVHVEKVQQVSAKATIVAERVLNRFVTGLGAAEPAKPVKFDARDLNLDQPDMNFQLEFSKAWRQAFRLQLEENAKSADGLVHDAQQNSAFGGNPDWIEYCLWWRCMRSIARYNGPGRKSPANTSPLAQYIG